MKRTFSLVIALTAASYLALPLPGLSAPLSSRIEIARDKVQNKKYKEHVLSETIAVYAVKIRGLQGNIQGLQQREGLIQARLDGKQRELEVVRGELKQARKRLAHLRTNLKIAETALAARLVEMYKADHPDALTVVLEADGFADLLDRAEFLERVSDQDQRIISRVRVLKAGATKEAKSLAALEQQAEVAADAIRARRDELAAAKGRLVDSRGELEEVRQGRTAILAKVRSSRIRLEGDLRAMEVEQARVQSALQGAQAGAFSPPAGGGPIKRGSGQLIWPVNGPVVSPFGQRWGRLHAGIDISAPAGTPIRAADSGRVVLMTSMSGYGNYTCVQHTASLASCYAHQSSFATSQGASVSQGDVIGYVGCSGHCFGDHLHFETRTGGSPVNPLGYL